MSMSSTLIGTAWIEPADYEQALRWFARALGLAPELTEGRCHIGDVMLEAGDLDGATEVYRAVAARRSRQLAADFDGCSDHELGDLFPAGGASGRVRRKNPHAAGHPGATGQRTCSSSRWSFSRSWAALTPRPEINLVLYHGVLVRRARWRAEVVAYRCAESDGATGPSVAPGGGRAGRLGRRAAPLLDVGGADAPGLRPRVLRCPCRVGRMQLIATIEHPAVILKILAHL
jgi:hypothetical protein